MLFTFLPFFAMLNKETLKAAVRKGEKKRMNIGIRLHDTREGTLNERLGFAKAQGFSCAHLAMSKALRGFSMADAPLLLNEALAEEVKAAFSENGMQCAVLGCYLNLADTDEESLKRTQEIYRAHLKFSRLIGAGVVGTETGPAKGVVFSQKPEQSEEAFELFLRCLAPVVRWAEEENAVIAVEPVATHIISTPERAEMMLDRLPSDHLRIILDAINLLTVANAVRADEVVADAIARLGDKVSVLHMKDHFPVQPGDERIKSTACGQGVMRYERLLSFAKAKNLPMTLEDTVPENAQAAREYLERAGAAL